MKALQETVAANKWQRQPLNPHRIPKSRLLTDKLHSLSLLAFGKKQPKLLTADISEKRKSTQVLLPEPFTMRLYLQNTCAIKTKQVFTKD
jgi:hypothetical protein